MAHIGIERFGTRDGENDRAEQQQRMRLAADEKLKTRTRIERRENRRLLHHAPDAKRPERDEPDGHDGAKQSADARRAIFLSEEDADQQHRRNGHGHAVECSRDDLEAFDRAKNGNGRRQNAVAIKKRRADHARDHHRAGETALGAVFLEGERRQGQDAAFALVIGAQHQDDIFDHYDERDRPEDQRKHTCHGFRRRLQPHGRIEALADGIERAGPDISENDAKRGDVESEPYRLFLPG